MPTTGTSPVRTYFANILKAVTTTMSAFTTATKHMAEPTFTVQYPRNKAELPNRTRHRLHVVIEDCIGCLQCERACPVDCIKIDAVKAPKDVDLGKASSGNPINFWLPSFKIDMAKCCYCALCTYPCPTECIVMTANYEYSTHDITDHVFEFSRMSPDEIEESKRIVAEDARKKAEEKMKAAEAKAKTDASPDGSGGEA